MASRLVAAPVVCLLACLLGCIRIAAMARALVTGGFGQIGSDLVPALVERYRDHADSCVVVLGHSRLPVTREQAAERGFILETGDGARVHECASQTVLVSYERESDCLLTRGSRDWLVCCWHGWSTHRVSRATITAVPYAKTSATWL